MALPTLDLTEFGGLPELDLSEFHPPAPEPQKESGDTWRGAVTAAKQLPQLGYGLLAGAGAVAESAFGEGGLASDLKKYGVEKYQAAGQDIAKDAKESDSLSYSWDQAKQGNYGAMVDWLQYGIGYGGVQALEALASGGIGAVVGKATLKQTAEHLASGMVAKEAARIAATKEGAAIAADKISKMAVANVAAKIGATVGIGAQAFGMEGGEIGGGLAEESVKRGTALTGAEIAKGLGTTLAAGGLEFVGDKFGVDVMLGKSGIFKPAAGMAGFGGKVARGGVAAAGTIPVEAGTEYLQTGLEAYGQGKEANILPWNQSAEAQKQAFDAAGLGGLGGGVMAVGGGLLSKPAQKPTDPADIADQVMGADQTGDLNQDVDAAVAAMGKIVGAPISDTAITDTGIILEDIPDAAPKIAPIPQSDQGGGIPAGVEIPAATGAGGNAAPGLLGLTPMDDGVVARPAQRDGDAAGVDAQLPNGAGGAAVDENYAKWLDSVSNKLRQEGWAQDVLDSMQERGESPQEIAETFWKKTYQSMPQKGKDLFGRLYKSHTGQALQEGDNPLDRIDLGDSAEHLDGTDRGFVALMREANSQSVRNKYDTPAVSNNEVIARLRSDATNVFLGDVSNSERVNQTKLIDSGIVNAVKAGIPEEQIYNALYAKGVTSKNLEKLLLPVERSQPTVNGDLATTPASTFPSEATSTPQGPLTSSLDPANQPSTPAPPRTETQPSTTQTPAPAVVSTSAPQIKTGSDGQLFATGFTPEQLKAVNPKVFIDAKGTGVFHNTDEFELERKLGISDVPANAILSDSGRPFAKLKQARMVINSTKGMNKTHTTKHTRHGVVIVPLGKNEVPVRTETEVAEHKAKINAMRPASRMVAMTDERLTNDSNRTELERMKAEFGWAERGGKLIRGMDGEAASRTKWVPMDERGLWQGRPDANVTEADAAQFVAGALNGKPIPAKGHRFINYLLDVAQEREKQLAALEAETEKAQDTLTPAQQNALDRVVGWAEHILARGELDAILDNHANVAVTDGVREWYNGLIFALNNQMNYTIAEARAENARYRERNAGSAGQVDAGRAGEGNQAGRAEDGAERDAQGLSITGQTNAEILAQERADKKAAEEAAKEPPAKHVTADQADMFATQGALFNSNRDQPPAKPAPEAAAQHAAESKPTQEQQATSILDRANVTGKDRLDIMRDFKDGKHSLEDLEAAYPDAGTPPVERGSVGAALTKEQKKSVLKTLVDVYKTKGAEKESKGLDRNGNERMGYAYQPELFEKSDITGAMVRYYVTLPDGRIAHPTELFPEYTQSDIDAEMSRRQNAERNARLDVQRYHARPEIQFDDKATAAKYWDEKSEASKSRSVGGWATIHPSSERSYLTNGEKFIMVPSGTMKNGDTVEALAAEGWKPSQEPKAEQASGEGAQNEPKFSQSATPTRNPHTLSTLTAAIDKAMGQGFSKLLELTGKFKIISSADIGKYLGGGERFSVAQDQTDTPAFKKWFGDWSDRYAFSSKRTGDPVSVVFDHDAKRPMVVYHATNGDFNTFETGRETSNATTFGEDKTERHAIFASPEVKFAEEYLRSAGNKNVMPLYMNIKSPIDLREGLNGEDITDIVNNSNGTITRNDLYYIEPKDMWQLFDGEFGKNFVNAAKKSGFDGALLSELDINREAHHDVYAAFEPTQIKSAIGNSGAFDPKNPDIRYSKDGRILAFVRNGETFLVADNISQTDDNVKGLLTHEISSHALLLGLSEPEYLKIVHRFKAMARMGNQKAKDAFARVPADTPSHLVDEEALSYFLENNPSLPLTKQFVAWFRSMLRKLGTGIKGMDRIRWVQWANKISDSDIVYMAAQAMRTAPETLKTSEERGTFKAERAYSDRYEVQPDTSRNLPIDGATLVELRRAAAGIESAERGITFTVNADGKAIVTGPARVKVPARFQRFANEHGLTLVVQRRNAFSGQGSVATASDGYMIYTAAASSSAEKPMPLEYRESGALYFGEIGEHLDRTGKTRFSKSPAQPARGAARLAVASINAEFQKQHGITNAFAPSNLGDAELIRAFKQAFNVEVIPVRSSNPASADFMAMQFNGRLYVNAEQERIGFVQLAGHELLHQIKKEQPALYEWFAGVARDYMQEGAERDYSLRLKQAGADLTRTDARQEILADFVGDALADRLFLQALADNNPTKFKNFIRTVIDWLSDVANKLSGKGFASGQYFENINGLRGYLIGVLDAYQSNGAIPESDEYKASRQPAIHGTAQPPAHPPRQSNIPLQGGQPGNRASWDSPEPSVFDDLVRKLQDKNIDLKRVVQAIKDSGQQVAEKWNAYLQEELFHGRAAKRVHDFVNTELKPLMTEMRMRGQTLTELDQFLHARHAKEANALIAERDPNMPDGGSGMTNQEADDYFANLPAGKRKRLEATAKRVDAIIAKTREYYASYGLVSRDTVDGWAQMFEHYVPLMREDHDGGMGIGQGFSIKGKEVKHRTGSTAKVVDILANIAMQREKAIVRGEKNRVAVALAGLAKLNPNPDFWTFDRPPTERVLNEKTGLVEERIDPTFRSKPNVVVAKIKDGNGNIHERAVIFNEHDERAVRMAEAMKNLDTTQLGGLLGTSAIITRYFSAINTQYNPIFGVTNLVRDVQGMALNLTSTPLAGKQKEVLGHILSAAKGIYLDARAERKGAPATSKWAVLWEELQDSGGMTGYRDLYRTSEDRAKAIEHELDPHNWVSSKWGKVFTAGGVLKVPLTKAQDMASPIFDWLSDYNLMMEGATRLSIYKTAIDNGLTKQQAASLAKNTTVNFNRKGSSGQQAGALYAFFNAAMQGTARIGETVFDMDRGDIKTLRLSNTGKRIIAGGMLLGVMQALALAASGFDDDEPPEFIRERNLIIPIGWAVGGKRYVTIPMPLGFHAIPNIGRIATEYAMGGFKKPAEHVFRLMGVFAEAFNPMGSSGMSLQTIAPTALDPFAALEANKDWTGKPIYKEDFSSIDPTPGFTRNKDTASAWSKFIAEGINYATGGTDYTPGTLSPTADQIDYLIGQVTGGVGREASKLTQTVGAGFSGEELPTHKMPLVGRFYGNLEDQSSQGNRYYTNLKDINAIDSELTGRRKDGLPTEEFRKENPESKLIMLAKSTDRQVRDLRRKKSELIKQDADRARIREIEERITSKMRKLNDRVDEVRAN